MKFTLYLDFAVLFPILLFIFRNFHDFPSFHNLYPNFVMSMFFASQHFTQHNAHKNLRRCALLTYVFFSSFSRTINRLKKRNEFQTIHCVKMNLIAENCKWLFSVEFACVRVRCLCFDCYRWCESNDIVVCWPNTRTHRYRRQVSSSISFFPLLSVIFSPLSMLSVFFVLSVHLFPIFNALLSDMIFFILSNTFTILSYANSIERAQGYQ